MVRAHEILRSSLAVLIATLVAATSIVLCPCDDAGAAEEIVPSCCAGHVAAPEGASDEARALADVGDEESPQHHNGDRCPHCDKDPQLVRDDARVAQLAVATDGAAPATPAVLPVSIAFAPPAAVQPRPVAHEPPEPAQRSGPRLHVRTMTWRC